MGRCGSRTSAIRLGLPFAIIGVYDIFQTKNAILRTPPWLDTFATAARAFMLSLGCIQALRCNTNACPTGVTTSNPRLYKG